MEIRIRFFSWKTHSLVLVSNLYDINLHTS
jgi:hypothetical protein